MTGIDMSRIRSMQFTAPNINGLLEDRKTETRRMIKHQPQEHPSGYMKSVMWALSRMQPGDLVYVKEAWRTFVSLDNTRPSGIWSADGERGAGIAYEAGGHLTISRGTGDREYRFSSESEDPAPFGRKRPAMYMPAAFSRITLQILEVRVEELHDITDAGALAEGIVAHPSSYGFWVPGVEHPDKNFPYLSRPTPREMYAALWDTIHGSGKWGYNPWIWAYRFRVIKKNITQVEASDLAPIEEKHEQNKSSRHSIRLDA